MITPIFILAVISVVEFLIILSCNTIINELKEKEEVLLMEIARLRQYNELIMSQNDMLADTIKDLSQS